MEKETNEIIKELNTFYNNLCSQKSQIERFCSELDILFPIEENTEQVEQKIYEVKELIKGENCNIPSNYIENLNGLLYDFRKDIQEQLKKEIYLRAKKVISRAKMAQYKKQQECLSKQKIGFFERILGKEKLRKEQLRNIELKIHSESIPEISEDEKTNNYSIRNTLAELYNAANNEVGQEYFREIKDYYYTVRRIFRDSNGEPFSEESIAKIAEEKISKDEVKLPSINNSLYGIRQETLRLKGQNISIENANAQKEFDAKVYFKQKHLGRRNYINLMINELETIKQELQNQEKDLNNNPKSVNTKNKNLRRRI